MLKVTSRPPKLRGRKAGSESRQDFRKPHSHSLFFHVGKTAETLGEFRDANEPELLIPSRNIIVGPVLAILSGGSNEYFVRRILGGELVRILPWIQRNVLTIQVRATPR